jgi:peptidoglycan/LPS O-acetylase OafA/YrhL
VENTHTYVTALENFGRIAARGLVIAGGLFWMIAAFSGPYVYQEMSLAESLTTAVWPFLATAVTLVVGWTYERLATLLLFAASAAVLVWGVLYAWELGVWILMSFVLLAPMLFAGVLFSLAAREETRRTRGIEPKPPTAVRERVATRRQSHRPSVQPNAQ